MPSDEEKSESNPATPKQVQYCKDLFRKVKMYYRCLQTDAELREEVLDRTGFDLDNLTYAQAHSIIGKLRNEVKRQRRF